METRCCENPEHTCFRKRGQRGSQFGYAVCMMSCPEGGDWDCEEIALPPPTPPADVAVVDESSMASRICSERFEPCLETQCCASEFDGCFHRAGRRFAMCKPLQPYMATGACVGDGTWECPGWEAPSTLSLASPPWPPVPHAVEIPRTQLAAPESEDDVVGDIGSGVLMFESSSGEFPSSVVIRTRHEPTFETRLLVAFLLAGVMLCCIGMVMILGPCVLKLCSRRAQIGHLDNNGRAPKKRAKQRGLGGKAKYTRQLSAAADELEQHVEEGEEEDEEEGNEEGSDEDENDVEEGEEEDEEEGDEEESDEDENEDDVTASRPANTVPEALIALNDDGDVMPQDPVATVSDSLVAGWDRTRPAGWRRGLEMD